MNTTKENLSIAGQNDKGKCEMTSLPGVDARLKQFFLEEARSLCPAIKLSKSVSEYSQLYALCKRMKRIVRLFTLLSEHHWGEILPDVQKACGFYLLEGCIAKKERIRIVELLAKEVGFVTQAAPFHDFISLLLQHYTDQLANLEHLLATCYKPETVQCFEPPEKK